MGCNPPNQTIYAQFEAGHKLEAIWTPVWIEGTLTTSRVEASLATASYSLSAEKIEPYEYRFDEQTPCKVLYSCKPGLGKSKTPASKNREGIFVDFAKEQNSRSLTLPLTVMINLPKKTTSQLPIAGRYPFERQNRS